MQCGGGGVRNGSRLVLPRFFKLVLLLDGYVVLNLNRNVTVLRFKAHLDDRSGMHMQAWRTSEY